MSSSIRVSEKGKGDKKNGINLGFTPLAPRASHPLRHDFTPQSQELSKL